MALSRKGKWDRQLWMKVEGGLEWEDQVDREGKGDKEKEIQGETGKIKAI